MKIQDRYSSATQTSNLKSEPSTTHSASDVLGAAGLAAKDHRTLPDGSRAPGNPLGIAMMRLFTASDRDIPSTKRKIVQMTARMVQSKAEREGDPMKWPECEVIALSVLTWMTDGTCKPCGGHGRTLIEGTRTIGDHACPSCRGSGRVQFGANLPLERLLLAQWLLNKIEREMAIAGAAAMAALAPRLEL